MRRLIAIICNGKEFEFFCQLLSPAPRYARSVVSHGGDTMFVHVWDASTAQGYQFDDYVTFHAGEEDWSAVELAVNANVRPKVAA
jgi:hypothetical protein